MDFEEIYQLYFKDVFLYVRSLSAEEGVAEEVTQETFFKALKAIDSYDGRKDIRAWLFTIARNTYYSGLRKQKPMSRRRSLPARNRISRCSSSMRNARSSSTVFCTR